MSCDKRLITREKIRTLLDWSKFGNGALRHRFNANNITKTRDFTKYYSNKLQ